MRVAILLIFFSTIVLSLDILSQADQEISLSDELVWLFSESSFLQSLSLDKVKEGIRNLERKKYDLERDKQKPTRAEEAKADLKKIHPAISKAKELERAFYRMAQVERNYRDKNPSLTRDTKNYLDRVKKEFLRSLREFLKDDSRIEGFLR